MDSLKSVQGDGSNDFGVIMNTCVDRKFGDDRSRGGIRSVSALFVPSKAGSPLEGLCFFATGD